MTRSTRSALGAEGSASSKSSCIALTNSNSDSSGSAVGIVFSKEELLKAQQNDPFCRKVIDGLSSESDSVESGGASAGRTTAGIAVNAECRDVGGSPEGRTRPSHDPEGCAFGKSPEKDEGKPPTREYSFALASGTRPHVATSHGLPELGLDRECGNHVFPASLSRPSSGRPWDVATWGRVPDARAKLYSLLHVYTLNEIAEAQRTSQLERFSGTNAGRRILENLGIGYHTQQGHKVTIPVTIRQTIRVDPIPRNVHPEYNRGRREARAKALLNAHSNNTGKQRLSASVTCERAEEAEEIAVALALTDPACKTVLCDSRQVIRNFAKGQISLRAARIISQHQVHREPEPPTRLLWFPAHVGEVSEEHRNSNETAHARARELTNRTGDGRPWYSSKDRMTSYNEITKAFCLARRTLPPPSDKLDRAQAVALRQLQTRTYPNPAQYHRMFPEIYTTSTCKVCRKEVATLTHMLWDCTKDPQGANSGTLPPRLSAALCSPSLDDQLWAVQQACEATPPSGARLAAQIRRAHSTSRCWSPSFVPDRAASQEEEEFGARALGRRTSTGLPDHTAVHSEGRPDSLSRGLPGPPETGDARRSASDNGWEPRGLPPCVANVATGKFALQSTSDSNGGAHLAVDGDSATCSSTLPQESPWFVVDLEDVHPIFV
ncbi:hypothetical protein HPB47_023165, partial [Ixodes persulcatus]